MNQSYQPISCTLHDYLEIACMRHYTLRVERIAGPETEGRALDVFGRDRVEYLLLDTVHGQVEVRLDDLKAITPQDAGAQFGRIDFA
ncbi:Rho-binding antiterminator [Andreprevotia chitinilytica]|uniref:Rho-binding antiterminator n=1 Tax=Andreprevotia chitinilytica TaxID=396808 RepID=UPI000555A212|nr:Rho-binding antiterminator [Andreprevotia chitinilytica]